MDGGGGRGWCWRSACRWRPALAAARRMRRRRCPGALNEGGFQPRRSLAHAVGAALPRVSTAVEFQASAAGTPDAAMAGNHDHTNGSVAQATVARRRREHRHARPQSRPGPADHPPPARVNRDASLSSAATGNGSFGRRAADGHEGSSDIADQPPAGFVAAPAQRSRGCSRSAPVAATANDHLAAATGAQEQTARCNPGLPSVAAAT